MRRIRSVEAMLVLWGLASACGSDVTEPATGALELTVASTGLDLDPDGYTITVDGSSPVAAPTNGTLTVGELRSGEHTVTLAGLASNCALAAPGPLTVTISGPAPGTGRFEVTCSLLYRLAYKGPFGVEVTNLAGTAHRTLLEDGTVGLGPWSPDGSALVVTVQGRNPSVWLINADGSDLRPVTTMPIDFPTVVAAVVWAPDGSALLYEIMSGPNSFARFLHRVNFDGSFEGDLAGGAGTDAFCQQGWAIGWSASWSPDGTRVSVNDPFGPGGFAPGVYTVAADGKDRHFVVSGHQPEWSPAGGALAFVKGAAGCGKIRPGGASIHRINPDGSSDRQLTFPSENETDESPSWSPDGSKLAFVRYRLEDSVRYGTVGPLVTTSSTIVINADGTGEHKVADFGSKAAWAPDGAHLALEQGRIYVVAPDGSDFHAVSEEQACCPTWRPVRPEDLEHREAGRP